VKIKNENKYILPLTLSLLALTGCSGDLSPTNDKPTPIGRSEARKRDFGNLFGDDFLMFGGPKKPGSPDMIGSTTVNPFIWRASLDTISFMPLSSADAVGGVIVTDWYTVPSKVHERIKVTIYVTNPQLRADAVKVTIYKQVNKGGAWVNSPADAKAATEMENIILSKARQLRVKHLDANK
jgi:hypothetical protein